MIKSLYEPRKIAGLAAVCLLLSGSANAEDYLFFSRSADIGENNAWVVNEFSEGPNIQDLHVRRFANGSWTSCVSGADCNTNAGRLTWGVPVYAPADGVIKTCWRNFDDNPAPGVKLKRVTGEDGVEKRIFTAGNHVNIETPDGKMILLAHLKKGSVPSGLCPFNAEEADVSKNGQSYPAAAIIPVGQRPQVRRGQFVGYAGNSGNSSGPHVHMHVKPVVTDTTEGSSVPMPYIQGWAHDYNQNSNVTENGWYKLNSDAITSTSGPTMIHPSPFLRRGDIGDEAVSSTDVAFLFSGRAVTAVKDYWGNLKLISWDFAGPGNIIRKHEVVEGAANYIRVVAHDSSHVVVALRAGNGAMKLILYYVAFNGTLLRLDDATADGVNYLDMALTSGPDKKIVTAMRRSDDRLKLMVWDLDFSTGSAKLKHLSSRLEQGTVTALALTRTSNFEGVAAAVRTAEDTLKVIPYKLSNGGATITRGTDYEAGVVTNVLDITSIPKGVVAAMLDAGNDLRLISLETNANGDIAGHKEFAVANGLIREVKITKTPLSADGNVVTSIIDSSGNLRLVGWTMSDKGENIRRSGTSIAGDSMYLSAAGHWSSVAGQSSRDFLLTVMRDGSDNLKLIDWEVNMNP